MTQVIIRNRTQQMHNVHLAVHPFKATYAIRMFMHKGDYDDIFHRGDLPQWHKDLSDALWDGIPGLSTMFLHNGEITLQHVGIFDDQEIVDMASAIIRPFLEREASLMELES